MTEYRIYCLNDEGGFAKSEEIEAPSDEEALAYARNLHHGGECEVWAGGRLVGRIEAHIGA